MYKKNKNDRKSDQVKIRVDKPFKARIRHISQKRGMRISEFVRMLVNDAYYKEFK